MSKIHIVLTEKGQKYLQDMINKGYINLPTEQRFEWDVLQDLEFQGGATKISAFLSEGRDTILGRAFAYVSEDTSRHYGKVLHRLIQQGYIKATREAPSVEGL